MAPSTPIYEGVFAIHKPADISSAGVLEVIKKQFNTSKLFSPWIEREAKRNKQNNDRSNRHKWNKKFKSQVKMGHGGTLDPQATGVLVVGVGIGTKSLSQFLDCTKDYDAQVLFGAATDTYDREGKVLETADTAHVDRTLVEEKLAEFRGDIMQKPPIYSALNVKGKKMYEYAREGGEIPELPKRATHVDRLELTEWFEPGSHSYRYPKDQLETEDAKAAKKILNNNTEFPKSSKKQKLSHGNEASGVSKEESIPATTDAQGYEEDPIPILVTSPKASEQDPGAETLKMSGALPDDPAEGVPTSTDTIDTPSTAEGSTENSASEADGSTSPAAHLRMTVSSGFYVRSLCYDLGMTCSSQAFMAGLVRSRQGRFTLGENVLEYTELEAGEDVWGPKVKRMLRTWMLDEGLIGEVEGEEDADDETWMAAYDESASSVGRRKRKEGE